MNGRITEMTDSTSGGSVSIFCPAWNVNRFGLHCCPPGYRAAILAHDWQVPGVFTAMDQSGGSLPPSFSVEPWLLSIGDSYEQ